MSSRASFWPTIVGFWRFGAILAIVISAGSAIAQNSSVAQTNNSIQSVLNPDGTVKLNAMQGSFDARGYRMVEAKDGAPRFVKATHDPNDVNWDPSFTVAGVGGYTDVVTHNGDTLYVGGAFGSAGKVVLNNIAKYNLSTNTWSAFDSTSADLGANGEVYSILVNGTDVYIGGQFTDAGGVAANNVVDYNTTTGKWSTLGSGTSNGVDNFVYTILYFGGNLYVGGGFSNAGGNAANKIARWDGTAWHNLGSGVDNSVYTMAVYNGALYVGGTFLNAGGSAANYIAKWDGTNWSTVGATATDLNGIVYTLSAIGNNLFVGGNFTTAGVTTVNYITKWNGAAWSTVGSGVNGDVYYFVQSGAKIYVMGSFTAAGLITVNNIASVDTSTNIWSALGSVSAIGTNAYTYLSDIVNNVLYVGGGFTVAGAVNAVGISSWNGTTWSSLGGTTNVPSGTVYALAISGNMIYVGGSFLTAGDVAANHIASYNTSTHTWSSLGLATANGVDGTVYAIAVVGGNVYAGGSFSNAGGSPARRIAMWNGTAWSTLGTSPNDGVSSTVEAMTTFGSDLYVGGLFTSAGGSSANRIAKWNGTAWSALGTGANNAVYALAAGTSQIYVGGAFTQAGGVATSHIASWNGTNWSALGSPTNGVDNTVDALYAIGDTAYAGGSFLNAGGNPANALAKWNTHQWTVLGAGVSGTVYSISGSGSTLYIGGSFQSSGLINAYRVGEWSIADSSFATLGDGTNGTVRCIAATDSDIYFGGQFSTAGDKPSYKFARYNPNGITAVNDKPSVASTFQLLQNYPNPFNPSTTIAFDIPHRSNVVLKVYDILGREVATLANSQMDAGQHAVVWNAERFSSGVYFYRLQTGDVTRTMKMILMK